MKENKKNSQNTIEATEQNYSAEIILADFETIKKEWIHKKFELPELIDKISDKLYEAQKYPDEYRKFTYYITGIVNLDSSSEHAYELYFSIMIIAFTIIEMAVHIIETTGNSAEQLMVYGIALVAYLSALVLVLGPRLKTMLRSPKETAFYHLLEKMLSDYMPVSN